MRWKTAAAALAAACLAGCATPVEPMYQWGALHNHTYDALRGEGATPQAQVEQMRAHAQKVLAAGQKLPPGYRAHMALMLLKLGEPAQAQAEFEAEKQAFPESAVYIDALARAAAKTKS
jgi:hypothetical protein